MPWPPRFLFIANRLCVDFALTGGTGRRSHWERWDEPGDLADWFAASSLRLTLAHVRTGELTAARRLRDAVWEAAQSTLRARGLPAAVVRELERTAARPDLVPVWRRGTVRWSGSSTANQALSSVARDALAFFGTDARQRLRECRNPACPLLFVDTSRPGRRAWCAMRRCGNMDKTARYRRKRKTGRKRGTRR